MHSYVCVCQHRYNYEVKEMGEVITFAGLYAADKGQAAAVTFYTFVGGFCAGHTHTHTYTHTHTHTHTEAERGTRTHMGSG